MKKVLTIMMAIVAIAFVGTSLSSYAQQKKTVAKKTTTTVQKKGQPSKKTVKRDTVRYNGEYAFRKEVIFMMGSNVVRKPMDKFVKEFADYVNEHKDCKILIEGMANDEDVGAKTREEWIDVQFMLSQKRADNVKDMLIKDFSVEADRITTKGLGYRDKLFEGNEFHRLAILYAIP